MSRGKEKDLYLMDLPFSSFIMSAYEQTFADRICGFRVNQVISFFFCLWETCLEEASVIVVIALRKLTPHKPTQGLVMLSVLH